MGVYYMDGNYTKVTPSRKNLGYTFLPANNFKILYTDSNNYYWMPITHFNLEKIPVQVKGVFKDYQHGKQELLGYEYYLVNSNQYPISSLYYFKEAKIEKKLELSHDSSAPILVYDNSLPFIKEKLRSRFEPKSLRESIKLVDISEIIEYNSLYLEELKSLYNYYKELSRIIDQNNKDLSKQDTFKLLEDKPKKTILRDYEMKEDYYSICTCYQGDNNYKDILIKTDIDLDDNTMTITIKINNANLGEKDLTMTPLKVYKKRFTNLDTYKSNCNKFIYDSEEEFIKDNNIILTKELSEVLFNEYGQQDYYTVEQIKSVINQNNKTLPKMKQLKKTGYSKRTAEHMIGLVE